MYATHLKIFVRVWGKEYELVELTMEQTLVCVGTDREMSVENPAYQGTDVDMLRNGS